MLRVYNRIDDLVQNVNIIKRYWTNANWDIYIAFNGKNAGYVLPEEITQSCHVIVIEDNKGHKSGASQLLLMGLCSLPKEYEIVVTVEADTWLLNDRVVLKYIEFMKRDSKVVWCGANWVDKYHSVALDLAVVRVPFFREHQSLLQFDESVSIEGQLAKNIHQLKHKFQSITEAEPTHIPKAMPFSFQTIGRRRRIFPRIPMLTHHIEDLPNGMQDKLKFKRMLLEDRNSLKGRLFRFSLICYELLIFVIPKSKWLRLRRYRSG